VDWYTTHHSSEFWYIWCTLVYLTFGTPVGTPPVGTLSGFWYTKIVIGYFWYVWYSHYVWYTSCIWYTRIGSVCRTLDIILREFLYIAGTFVHFTLYKLQLNPQLRYNYFRFGKNIRHLGIPLPVSISTISLYWGCYSASSCPNFIQIGPSSVISIFKIVNAEAQFYFRFWIGWRPSLQKVNVYQQSSFVVTAQSTSEL